jgi:uncharacterized protein YwbE
MLESAIQSWRGRLSEEAFDVLERIVGYVDAHYVTHVVFNGVNELKFRRSGKTLLTLYIEEQSITALVIFGKQERLNYEAVQASFSEFIQNYYRESNTYHDGKWMFIRLHDPEYVHDVLRLVQIKKKPDQRGSELDRARAASVCTRSSAHSHNIQVLAKLPLDPAIADCCDQGTIESMDATWLEPVARALENLGKGEVTSS